MEEIVERTSTLLKNKIKHDGPKPNKDQEARQSVSDILVYDDLQERLSKKVASNVA